MGVVHFRGTTFRRAASLLAVVALVGLALLSLRRDERGSSALQEGRGRIAFELERRARSRAQEALPDLLALEPLDHSLAKLFYPAIDKRLQYDPIVYARLRPGDSYTMHLAEHPAGAFEMRTNSLGMREDQDPAAEKPDLRVLVTGDSHTDGVVPNAESFANRLEELLARERPERSVEALNAGVGGYCFYNYLRVPERWAELAPDLVVVAVYGGNDFAETMLLERWFRRRGSYATGPWTVAPLLELEEQRPVGGILSQDLVEVCYFANNPGDVEVCVETVVALSRELRRRCAEGGAELVFVYIPPATRGQPRHFGGHARVAREATGLGPEQLAVSDRLADRWLAGLAEAGIPALDMRPRFRAAEPSCYWRTDLHINVEGHARIAAALAELLRGG